MAVAGLRHPQQAVADLLDHLGVVPAPRQERAQPPADGRLRTVQQAEPGGRRGQRRLDVVPGAISASAASMASGATPLPARVSRILAGASCRPTTARSIELLASSASSRIPSSTRRASAAAATSAPKPFLERWSRTSREERARGAR